MSKICHKNKYLELIVVLDQDECSQGEAKSAIDQIHKSCERSHVGSSCPIILSASSVHLVQFQSGNDVCAKSTASADDSSIDTANNK